MKHDPALLAQARQLREAGATFEAVEEATGVCVAWLKRLSHWASWGGSRGSPSWSPERKDQLRAFWAEGLSTSEIARRMGTTKNAIIGCAHRLHLPSRPSPIRTAAADSSPKPKRIRRIATRPQSVPAAAEPMQAAKPLPQQPASAPRLSPPARSSATGIPAEPRPGISDAPVAFMAASRTCQWIEDHRGSPGWPSYCGQAVTQRTIGDGLGASPYCSAHHRRCYVRRAEMAA